MNYILFVTGERARSGGKLKPGEVRLGVAREHEEKTHVIDKAKNDAAATAEAKSIVQGYQNNLPSWGWQKVKSAELYKLLDVDLLC